MNFTERELELMSLGILDLIRDACEAEKLIPVSDAKSGIYRYCKELQALNTKICTMEAGKDESYKKVLEVDHRRRGADGPGNAEKACAFAGSDVKSNWRR